jgi:hypothetical protein
MQLTCFLVRLDVAPNIDEDMLLCEMNAMGASNEHPKRQTLGGRVSSWSRKVLVTMLRRARTDHQSA